VIRVTQQRDEVCRGHGLAEDEPLVEIAAKLPQKIALGVGLHTLGGHCHAQALPQCDDGLHNGGVSRPPGEIGNEGTIDLQFVDWEALEVAQ
jgi:hypothetical protein